ncbi:fimbria/pilus outer membrane usher protein [Acinetobacter shaoyimingii]|uniref:Fimbrial biogenesis outer membrane usher protein n=1 Tax=Acinetobacter shaoyimingii TaxID=2715164 RepID=A0A6G8RV85_9GAMM|nr:fimbria/pilus outer membrane usher protein [Acinetobacter shaoyimingii]QIO05740.1 fimbrial biogenesis outer membrane usher protein [Acinetobacter shaoyimingii]
MLLKQFNPYFLLINAVVGINSTTHAMSEQNKTDDYVFEGVSLFGEENKDIDLGQFQHDFVHGEYLLQTQVNQKSIGKILFKIDLDPKTGQSDLCIDHNQLNKLSIKKQVYSEFDGSRCIFIKQLDPYVSYDLDTAQQKLNLSIPDLILDLQNENDVTQNDFDSGVSALFSNYQYSYNFSNNADTHTQNDSHFLNLNAGLNFAGWYFRHQGNLTSDNQTKLKYSSNNTVLYHDFVENSARMSLGQIQTQSLYLDAVSLLGVQYATDNMMRLKSQRYFSPVIENIANSQAQVMVYQNGHKLYEKTVPAGPFKIDDIRGVSDSGDLSVDIIESDGSKRTFIVPLNMQFNLLRAGQKNINFATGYYQTQESVTDLQVVQASFDYGLNHATSLFLGGQYSPSYSNIVLGALWNTPFGGIQTSYDQAIFQRSEHTKTGEKFKLDYRTGFFAHQKSNISASFVYQSPLYQSLSNSLSSAYQNVLTSAEQEWLQRTNLMKQELRFSMSQRFGKTHGGTLSANIIQSQYWNDPKSYMQYQMSYSNNFKQFAYAFSLSQSESQKQEVDRNFAFTLMMPLKWKNRHYTTNTQIQHQSSPSDSTLVNMNVSSNGGAQSKFGYGLTASSMKTEEKHQQQLGATVSYKHPKVALNSTLAWNDQQQQFGISASGGLVAHRYGLTFARTLGDTFTIAHIQDVNSKYGSKKWSENYDRWGNAIYPNLTAYEANYVQFKPTQLPLNVTLDRFENRVVPKRFSSTMAVFEASRSENIILILSLKDNSQIPLGSTLYNDEGAKVGTVGQSNQVFIDELQKLKPNSAIRWGEGDQQHCLLGDVDLQNIDLNSTQYQMIEAVCQI